MLLIIEAEIFQFLILKGYIFWNKTKHKLFQIDSYGLLAIDVVSVFVNF